MKPIEIVFIALSIFVAGVIIGVVIESEQKIVPMSIEKVVDLRIK